MNPWSNEPRLPDNGLFFNLLSVAAVGAVLAAPVACVIGYLLYRAGVLTFG